ncbi:MAG: dTMP kinase [Armatimonadetes bacterium]|nr:dTMP kinase [Armatimonadota bacterium]
MFITFEGPEGAGKSTLIRSLASELESLGHDVLTTREPGAGEFGQAIRSLLLHGDDLPATSEVFLFLADRSHHMVKIIQPALNEDRVVLCDRHAESTIVYQGYARGLDVELLRKMNLMATGNVRPDLIFLLDLPVEVGLSRIENKDRLDSEPIEFHQKVRDGFLAEREREPSRWHKIDATQAPQAILTEALGEIKKRLK